MSEKNINEPAARGEEPELSDEALEQVAGGCQEGQSVDEYGKIKPSSWLS